MHFELLKAENEWSSSKATSLYICIASMHPIFDEVRDCEKHFLPIMGEIEGPNKINPDKYCILPGLNPHGEKNEIGRLDNFTIYNYIINPHIL